MPHEQRHAFRSKTSLLNLFAHGKVIVNEFQVFEHGRNDAGPKWVPLDELGTVASRTTVLANTAAFSCLD